MYLAVQDRDAVWYLHHMQGRASAPIVSTVGSRLPMHVTAVGKVLLPDAENGDSMVLHQSKLTPHSLDGTVQLGAAG